MNKTISEINLSNGKKVFYLNKEEVEFLDYQIKSYLKHGINLKKGNTVFDVGANIGMFSLYCCELCENEVDIYAFEPIPEIFLVLQKNVERFNSDKINIYNFGISNRNQDTVIFDYFRDATGFSTMYPEKPEEFRKSVRLIMLQNIDALASFVAKIRLIQRLPSFLQTWFMKLQLFTKLRAEKVNCQVKTISQIISEHNIQHIDLLKIDVEKSELDVLLGIDDRDWSKIQQIVIEVHDLDNRVNKIKDLLSMHNFKKIVDEQESFLAGSEYYNIYAMR